MTNMFTACLLTVLKRGYQTWNSRDLSLGLEMSRDPFLQVLVSVLVLNLRVLVLVFEPQSLGLGLGLG